MGKNTHRIEADWAAADYDDQKYLDEDVSEMKNAATSPEKVAGFEKIEQPAFEAYVVTKVSQMDRKAAKKAKMAVGPASEKK